MTDHIPDVGKMVQQDHAQGILARGSMCIICTHSVVTPSARDADVQGRVANG